MSDQEPTSVQPGMVGARRYPRTFAGLIGSTVVLVAAVVSCSVLGNARGGHPELACSPVTDWQSAVVQAQAAHVALAYPGTLPEGWRVTSATWDNDPQSGVPRWRIGLHNADCSQFAGLTEQQAPTKSLQATIGAGEVSKTLPGTGTMTILAHATTQAALDQFIAALTTVALPH